MEHHNLGTRLKAVNGTTFHDFHLCKATNWITAIVSLGQGYGQATDLLQLTQGRKYKI